VLGILGLASRFDKATLENACQEARATSLWLSYCTIKRLLESRSTAPHAPPPARFNLRGEAYCL